MYRLLLLRHAKSGWPTGVEDRDRPLNARGREAAPLIAAYMASENLLPDLAIVSAAVRTRETFGLIEQTLPCRSKIDERIYLAAPGTMLAAIRQTNADIRTLLLVGHNPGLHDLAVGLVGHGDRYAFANLKDKMPTAALTVLDFTAEDWKDVAMKGGRLNRYITPKSLGGIDED
jgi:phosphohistidine phosphatase